MQNDVANHTVNLNHHHDDRDERKDHHNALCSANAASCRVAVHRTWFFWSFILIPVLVILGWSQYVTVKGPVPWLGLGNMEHAEQWGDWMRYYVWLQLVWLPANMMIFLIWCALGVRIWNCKRMSRSQFN